MIDTQTIRKRILSLAMMGNLVEQNSSEGSALPLVEALSKSLNGRPFQNDISEEEIPYKLPDSWVWCRLSDIGITNIGLLLHQFNREFRCGMRNRYRQGTKPQEYWTYFKVE